VRRWGDEEEDLTDVVLWWRSSKRPLPTQFHLRLRQLLTPCAVKRMSKENAVRYKPSGHRAILSSEDHQRFLSEDEGWERDRVRETERAERDKESRERDRERERQRQRDRERVREREIESERQREQRVSKRAERETERETERQRESQREQRETKGAERDREREANSPRQRGLKKWDDCSHGREALRCKDLQNDESLRRCEARRPNLRTSLEMKQCILTVDKGMSEGSEVREE
jgi:hypothetical protein